MKVDYVALSSTCDEYYLDFWPLISKVWKLRFNYTPVLFLVHDNKQIKVSEEFGKVIYFDPLPNYPLHIQAQCSRYWLPVTQSDSIWMTSDIDMFPISKQYFIESLKSIPDDKFVSMNAKRVGLSPCCYNVARGNTFKEILNLTNSYEEYLNQIDYKSITYHHTPSNQNKLMEHWGADESHCNKKINEFYDKDRFVLTTRNGIKPSDRCRQRLDRQYMDHSVFDINTCNNYIDFHSWRPYKKYKEKIDDIVNFLIGSDK